MTTSTGDNVILTGLPRSGTTLACELLNAVADTIALDEPLGPDRWPRTTLDRLQDRIPPPLRGFASRLAMHAQIDNERFADEIELFFAQTRRAITSGEGVSSKSVDSEVLGAKWSDQVDEQGLRLKLETRGEMFFQKELSDRFVLVVKHLGGFVARLEGLTRRFPTYAIVRNPLSVLMSWQTVAIPMQRGRGGRAERMDPALRRTLEETDDVIDRQMIMLAWFFERFNSSLPRASIIRYEDLVASGGRALAVIVPGVAVLGRTLESRNRASVYDPELIGQLGVRILRTDGAWWEYYEHEDVRCLIETP